MGNIFNKKICSKILSLALPVVILPFILAALFDKGIQIESTYWWLYFLLYIVCALLYIFLSIKQNKDKNQLEQKNELSVSRLILKDYISLLYEISFFKGLEQGSEFLKARITSTLVEYTSLFSDIFDFGNTKFKNCERISIFLSDGKDSFSCVARYSKNTDYQEIKRLKYPKNQGCLGEAWKNSVCVVQNIVYKEVKSKELVADVENISESASGLPQEYSFIIDGGGKCSISKFFEKSIGMKSKFYFAKRIDKDKKPVGVIILEATERKRFSKDDVQEKLAREENNLAIFMGALGQHIPKLVESKIGGF